MVQMSEMGGSRPEYNQDMGPSNEAIYGWVMYNDPSIPHIGEAAPLTWSQESRLRAWDRFINHIDRMYAEELTRTGEMEWRWDWKDPRHPTFGKHPKQKNA